MPLFKRGSHSSGSNMSAEVGRHESVKEHFPSSNVHDPILSAIQDPQPFEQQMEHSTTQNLSPQGRYRDMFGQVIEQPDLSNPTRSRNERPLDTIRGFEYACTGDERIRDELESQRLGWAVRRGFGTPQFDTNPYAAASAPSNPVISFSGTDPAAQQGYVRQQQAPEPPKKKRGLFGRKKG